MTAGTITESAPQLSSAAPRDVQAKAARRVMLTRRHVYLILCATLLLSGALGLGWHGTVGMRSFRFKGGANAFCVSDCLVDFGVTGKPLCQACGLGRAPWRSLEYVCSRLCRFVSAVMRRLRVGTTATDLPLSARDPGARRRRRIWRKRDARERRAAVRARPAWRGWRARARRHRRYKDAATAAKVATTALGLGQAAVTEYPAVGAELWPAAVTAVEPPAAAVSDGPAEAIVVAVARRRREDLTPNRRPYGQGRRSLHKRRMRTDQVAARERRERSMRTVGGAVANRRPYGRGRRSLYKQRALSQRVAARERRERGMRTVAGAVAGLTSAVTDPVRKFQADIDLCDRQLVELARSGVAATAAVVDAPIRPASGVGGLVGGRRRRRKETRRAANKNACDGAVTVAAGKMCGASGREAAAPERDAARRKKKACDGAATAAAG